MNTKICPNCNAEVPGVAHLCKHCFHDFHVVMPKRKSPLFTLLFLAVGTALVSAAAYGYIHSQNRTFKISIDQETKSMVFTTRYTDKTDVDRVYFKDVATVKYVMNTSPHMFEVDVVTIKGDRFVYQQSDEPLEYAARLLGENIGKPVVIRDESGAPGMSAIEK